MATQVASKKGVVPKTSAYSRSGGNVSVHMIIGTGAKEDKLEWTFEAQSKVAANNEGKRLCLEHGKKWPQDVVVWDVLRGDLT